MTFSIYISCFALNPHAYIQNIANISHFDAHCSYERIQSTKAQVIIISWNMHVNSMDANITSHEECIACQVLVLVFPSTAHVNLFLIDSSNTLWIILNVCHIAYFNTFFNYPKESIQLMIPFEIENSPENKLQQMEISYFKFSSCL